MLQQQTDAALQQGQNPDANLIVNYLPPDMNEEALRLLFAQIGTIKSCKLMVDKWTQKSLGYGFVEFVHPSEAEAAIRALDGKKMQTKTLKVSLARPSSAVITKANLYVKGLPLTMSEADLTAYFSHYGQIINVRILRNGDNGPSKGVGFVRFDKRSEAEAAIAQLNNVVPPMGVAPLQIKFADDNVHSTRAKAPYPPQMMHNQMNMMHMGGYGGMGGYGYPGAPGYGAPGTPYGAPSSGFPASNPGFGGAQQSADPYAMMYGGQAQFPANPQSGFPRADGMGGNAPATPGYPLFVYNVPNDTDEGLLYRLFGPYGAVGSVKVIRDPATQQCKGFGFVTMVNYAEALQAIAQLNGHMMGNRPLQVSFKTDKNKQG